MGLFNVQNKHHDQLVRFYGNAVLLRASIIVGILRSSYTRFIAPKYLGIRIQIFSEEHLQKIALI